MGFTLNLTKENIEQAKGNSFEPLPKGTYGARIYEAKVKSSKNSGNPMYEINYKVNYNGSERKIRGWHVIQGPGSFSSRNLLKALGLPVPEGEGEFEFPDADELIGEELNLKLDVRSYETLAGVRVEEVTRYQNNVAGTFPYDEDRHTVEGDDDGYGGAAPGGKLL